MRPVAFINGVIFGSAVAISGVLGVLLFFRFVLNLDGSLDQSVVRSGLPVAELLHYILIFSVLSVLAGTAFWGQLAQRSWRWVAEYILLVALAAVALNFLATTENRGRDLAVLAGVAAMGVLLWLGGWYSGLIRRIGAWFEGN